MYSYVLFDLDGTISDSGPGIINCTQYALKYFGIHEPDREKLTLFIGPPLRESFMKYYGFSPMQAQAAIEKYRERYSAVGKYENQMYPGIPELLAKLKNAGVHLAVASSKPEVFVEEILVHFGIRQYFEIVVGSQLNGPREKKEEVMEEVMRQLAARGAVSPQDVVLVGDRCYDVYGAKSAGAHSVGVTYGYAQPGELEQAGAEVIVHTVEELEQVLFGSIPRNLYERYRSMPAREDSAVKKAAKALGMCALAMGTYFLVNALVATVVVLAGLHLTGHRPVGAFSAEDFWLNMGNAAGILTGFLICLAVWYQHIRIRPGKKVDGLSLIPVVIASAALAMGLNGAITLVELYKYSPAFQEVAALQTETPVWLGILSFGILAPLGEELVFRGLVFGQLRKVGPAWMAIIFSALAFGIFHGNLVQGVYATLLGCLFAGVYELYGTHLVPVLMHGVANLFVYLLLDCTEFGAVFVTPLPCIFMLAAGIIALVLMISWQKNTDK